MRFMAFVLVAAACGGAPPNVAASAPSATTLQLERADIFYWAATTDESGAHARPISADFHPGMTVGQTFVECQVDTLANEPPKIACASGAARADGADEERWFRERMAACFRVEPRAPSAATLREIERSLSPEKWWPEAPPSAASEGFVTITVFRRTSLQVSPEAGGNGCEGVRHPCDPGPYRAPTPGGWVTDVKRTFATYGPHGYVFRPGSRRNLFPEAGTQALSSGAARSTEFGVALDRAVQAEKAGDLDAVRLRTRELDEVVEAHPPPLDDDARVRLANLREALHAIARGDYVLADPCKASGPLKAD